MQEASDERVQELSGGYFPVGDLPDSFFTVNKDFKPKHAPEKDKKN